MCVDVCVALQLDPPDSLQLYLRSATVAYLFAPAWLLAPFQHGKYLRKDFHHSTAPFRSANALSLLFLLFFLWVYLFIARKDTTDSSLSLRDRRAQNRTQRLVVFIS